MEQNCVSQCFSGCQCFPNPFYYQPPPEVRPMTYVLPFTPEEVQKLKEILYGKVQESSK